MADTTYIVQPGDSLSAISKKYYGSFSMTDTLAQLNNIINKNVIQPGQKLLIPNVEEAQVVESNIAPSGSSKAGKTFLVLLALGVVAYVGFKYVKKKKTSSLSGKKEKTIIGKTKSGKAVYVNKTADDEKYKNFTSQDHTDAADIHYKKYHKKNADGSTVLHGKRSMESHLKAADKK